METFYVEVTTPLDQSDFFGFLILRGVRRYEAHRILRDRINDNRDRRKEKALRDRRPRDRDRPFAIATLRYVDPHCSSGTSIPGATEHALIFLSIIE